jgi:glycosyltransferase involved in cell wall biosynthesis
MKPMQHLSSSGSTYITLPLITIAIPTRNRSAQIRDSVESALAQTYSNIEVLVSDNASTDDTLATLESISNPKLRILTNSENIGSNGNYNKCVREANGDYLIIVPDDDRISKLFAEKCVSLLDKEPSIQAVVGAYDVSFADENRRRPAVLSKKLSTGIWDGTEILKEFLRGKLAAITLSTAVRTTLLRQIGGFSSEYLTADDILVLAHVLLTGRAGLINEPCATLTIHNSTVSTHAGLDCGFKDIQRVMVQISEIATRVIADEANRREIQALTARYVAKKLLDYLVLFRRQGATLREVAGQLRTWRRQSPQCSLFDFVAVLRLKILALLLLPAAVTKLLLQFRPDGPW